ncbi:MAG: tRNA dihydrouridine synthase DusB [Alphaproteobacteria bacterium]|nr:tRNA dihydrouridine synthase DusB [Alphaproteobacteria bacterium]
MTLKIRDIELSSNVILAPMTGVTDLPFRTLVKRLGVGMVVSEMIASQSMVRQTRRSMQMCEGSPEEYPMAVQLAGCDPSVMAEAAKLNEDLGAQIIDINMGCPVKKIAEKSFAGSALMKDEIHAARIIEATVKAVRIPVTLKMRTGWDDTNRNAPRLAKIAEDLGIQMITVHGRTRMQMYTGRSDWAFIQNVKSQVRVPVIGNGDIVTENDAKTLLDVAGVDGVMIGRGSYGRPWFPNQVQHFLKTGQKLEDPTLAEKYNIIMGHLNHMMEHHGEHTGMMMAKKHIGWYSKGLPDSASFRLSAMQSTQYKELMGLLDAFFSKQIGLSQQDLQTL